jgi:hypothetical protein
VTAAASLRERARSRFLTRVRGEGSRWAKRAPAGATKRPRSYQRRRLNTIEPGATSQPTV